ncbi:MAG: RagB/SusD family nutrient uptake outer membrane protein [Bacteroidota bacterium]
MKSILYNFLKLSLIFLFVICHSSCEKFLDEKPRKDLIVPRSVADLQKILDGDPMTGQYPQSAIVGSDDFYLTGTTWASVPYIEERNSYIWDKDVTNDNDWYFAYQRIFNSNAVLDELPI